MQRRGAAVRQVPKFSGAQDWPRIVAEAVNGLIAETNWTRLQDFADDTAAAAGGVAVGSIYRTGSVIKVRVS